MAQPRHLFIYRAYGLADVVGIVFAVLVAAKISGKYMTGFSLRYMLEMRFSLVNVVGALLLLTIWMYVFCAQGLYNPRHTIQRFGELRGIAIASGVAIILFAAISLFFRISLFTPLFFAVLWPAVVACTFVFRRLLEFVVSRLHLGDNNSRHIVVVGTNATAHRYAEKIRPTNTPDYHFTGFLDDLVMISESRDQLLGSLGDFKKLVETHVVDEVVVAMPIRSCTKAIQEVIDYAHERGIAVRFPMAQIFSGLTTNNVWRIRQERSLGADGEFSDDLVVYSGHQMGGRYIIKRVFDILWAVALLLLASPAMLLAALAIRATSRGPVLFVQDRYGYNGRVFKLYKFRTMVNDADKMQDQLRARNERDGAAFKIKNDPRVTPLGRFLRMTSIDELPQLFNVLRGEMSMVGPRPLPLADYKRMDKVAHRRRLSVLPGITGPWQISGRDNISFEEWMRMDLEYIDHWRLMTDLRILLLTIPVVLLARGSK